jgi:hypothetical protein
MKKDERTLLQKMRDKAAELERRRKKERESRDERQRQKDRLHEQYLNPHSPVSVVPPLDGSNPERHRLRRPGEDQVGPEPGPFGQQHPGMKW